jgi:hypothetical protein
MNPPSDQPPEPEPTEPEAESWPWLSDERIKVIAERCAKWLSTPTTWIDRRKDTITVLDDRSIRWQTSVDFGCHADSDGIERPCPTAAPAPSQNGDSAADASDAPIAPGEALYCSPLFVLPKQPSGYMAFDLTDETGRSLSLSGRDDNAKVTGEILVEMARRLAPDPASAEFEEVAEEIRKIATNPSARKAKHHARWRLKQVEKGTASATWRAVAQKGSRFAQWLETAAEASIVVVLFRSHPAARKRIKLSFQASVRSTYESWLLGLGFKPYVILIDSPWIEARGYHVEATAPPGVRIEHAWHRDDKTPTGQEGGDFTRHVHLRRPGAVDAGAGALTLRLRISSEGFLTGAWLASLFVVVALLISALEAKKIAPNPSTAPALLLLLPGLLTSLVGRPDRHALTTRLLSLARYLLILSGVLAYTAAAVVALAGKSTSDEAILKPRVDYLHVWLWPIFGVALATWLALSIPFVRGHPKLRWMFQPREWGKRWEAWNQSRFDATEVLLVELDEAIEKVYAQAPKAPPKPKRKERRKQKREDKQGGTAKRQPPPRPAIPLPVHPKDRPVKENDRERLREVPGSFAPPQPARVERLEIRRRRRGRQWVLSVRAWERRHGTFVEVTGHLKVPWPLRLCRGRIVRRQADLVRTELDALAKQLAQPEDAASTAPQRVPEQAAT